MIKYYRIELNAWEFHMGYELWDDALDAIVSQVFFP